MIWNFFFLPLFLNSNLDICTEMFNTHVTPIIISSCQYMMEIRSQFVSFYPKLIEEVKL